MDQIGSKTFLYILRVKLCGIFKLRAVAKNMDFVDGNLIDLINVSQSAFVT